MMMIRPYKPADRQGCMAVFASNVPAYFAPQELADFTGCLDDLEKPDARERSRTEYFVGCLNKVIVACGGYALDTLKKEAWFTWGMVARDHHRQGLGLQLLHHRMDAIFQACPEASIYLDTTPFSYRFFERAGFAVTGTVKDGYAPGYDRIDMVCKR